MYRAMARFNGSQHNEEIYIDAKNSIEWNGTHYNQKAFNWTSPIDGTVYGTLFNFHGDRMDARWEQPPYTKPPEHVVMFIKPQNTLNGHMQPISLPKDVDTVEVGAGLGVVIGQTMSCVSDAVALDYVSGYTIVNDVTVPHDSFYRPDIKNKVRDGFCPVGPWVMDRSAIENPNQLDMYVYVNEEQVYTNNMSNLDRPIEKLLADITEFMTLYPGDVIIVGRPLQAPLAKADNHVVIDIPGVGRLENTIIETATISTGGGRK
ncbi:fumarylacetoacetate hydrolase family protein [Lentibacillus saliphilus]|uniref:fumarylacetoacetate hydrolase family protein n=1 Tax=Lentibacillus saliphilus TaxID=2737028 RepID=UPI001C2FFA6A|nr:fumarylacetoacetate hydrolase family protein [Lentibacillus saliphilus]